MKVTRVAYSASLNVGKWGQLVEQAARLGRVRTEVWQRFGSVMGVGVSDRQVRDRWMAEGFAAAFGVLANAWKETVRDAMSDIQANQEAAKVKVRRAIARHTSDIAERKLLYTALRAGTWTQDAFLSRQLRQHAATLPSSTQPCGTRQIGVDKGYTEVLTDSDGIHHGSELGKLLTAESDRLKRKNVRRAKLRSIASKATERGDHTLAVRIERNNLGTVKKARQSARWRQHVRTVTFTAVHDVVDKAALIAAEDLTKRFAGREYGRDMNRRLAAWTKGVTAEALASVSERRGSALAMVNAAYTSQVDPDTDTLGVRRGEKLHCPSGVVWQADHAAAINVLHRLADPDIGLHTPHREVKRILRERTDRHRISTADPGLQRQHERRAKLSTPLLDTRAMIRKQDQH